MARTKESEQDKISYEAPHTPDAEIDAFISIIKANVICPIRSLVCVGAMDGYELKRVAAAFPESRAIALEACLETWLRHLAGSWIESYPLAGSDSTGVQPFHLMETRALSSLYPRDQSKATTCHGIRLDDLCAAITLEVMDVLMIDVEGAAYEVLKGCGSMLDTIAVITVETENGQIICHGQHADNEVSGMLIGNGFKKAHRKDAGGQYETIWLKESLCR